MRTNALPALLVCAACHVGGGGISGAEPETAVAPSALAFGGVYVGAQASETVAIANSGAGGDEVSWTLTGDTSFSVESLNPVPLAGGGLASLPVRFTAATAGAVSGVLTLVARSGTFTVALSATGLADLTCAPSGPCDQPTFDPDAGACLHASAPDGTACSDTCLENAQCHGGSCLGTPLSCDDGNACTNDFCVPNAGDGGGCQHTPVTCDGQCTSGACDPVTGCSGAAQPDGTPCHLWWEPCVSDATCAAGVCDSPTAEAEVPGQLRWDAGLPGAIGPFAVDDAGTSYFVSQTADAPDGTPGQTVISTLDVCGRPLWISAPSQDYAGVLLDSDQAIAWTSDGLVRALDRATGLTLWETNLADAGPLGGTAFAAAPALTANGQLVFAVTGFAPQIWALWRDGQPAWSASITGRFPTSVAADFTGNAYVSWAFEDWNNTTQLGNENDPEDQGQQDINHLAGYVQGFDPSGRIVMNDSEVPFMTPLSVGAGRIFLGDATALIFDGGVLYGPPDAGAGDAGAPACWSLGAEGAGLIDARGRVLAPSQVDATWQALGPTGMPLWDDTSLLAGTATLADDGSLFYLAPLVGCPGEQEGVSRLKLLALDGDAGTLTWQAGFADVTQILPGYLALTPAASLVFAGTNQVYAVFAGQTKPPASAPWYRAGANNANTSAASR